MREEEQMVTRLILTSGTCPDRVLGNFVTRKQLGDFSPSFSPLTRTCLQRGGEQTLLCRSLLPTASNTGMARSRQRGELCPRVALSSTLLYQEASRQTESLRTDVQSFFPSHCCDNRHAEKMRVGEGETDDHGVATDDHGVALSSTFP
jgi:hypothetical protein